MRTLAVLLVLTLAVLSGCGAATQQLDLLATQAEAQGATVDQAVAIAEAAQAQIAEAEIRSQELLAKLALAQAEAASLAGQPTEAPAPPAPQVITRTVTKTVTDGSLAKPQEEAIQAKISDLQSQLSAQRAAVMSADEGLAQAQAIIEALRAAANPPLTEKYGAQGIVALILSVISFALGWYRRKKVS